MDRLVRSRHLLPLTALALIVLLDLVIGRGHGIIGLLVMAPLVAATSVGRRATATYGAAAFAAAALLGWYDRMYEADAVTAQVVRLVGLAVGTVVAVVACTLRLRREAQLARARAEVAATRGSAQLAERLQLSLLTDPPATPGLDMAVRYLPAVRHAQVGGDWYDAFPLGCGSTMLVIGDVAGHDTTAAATMAQARGVLRGIAQSVVESPAGVLGALDRALGRLGVDTLITLVVATAEVRPDGAVVVRWSNAGHPPPAVLRADGTAELLQPAPNRLIGAGPVWRDDHTEVLRPGDTLLLYTDGLVERRGVPLDDSIDWLAGRLTALAGRPLEELCDALLAGMPGRVADDVALLAVRVG
ncbi:PP2C family protein-serine/threonine phosphatase [Modestobacter sp. NPDC049651]|uniref:PP2C family protein-serine/threonine phosphatase n=1 Tax=unclassified Modestobacter TaxID=2643866 RepID=UPI0033D50B6F